MFDGRKIKELRQERCLTLRKLAALSGISSFSYIRNIEEGIVKDPSISTIIKLARAFDVSMDELID